MGDEEPVCRYPRIYVADGAATPGAPYEATGSGISPGEAVEIAHEAGELGLAGASILQRTTGVFSLWKPTAEFGADVAAESLAAMGTSLAVGAVLFVVLSTEPVHYCCDICPTCYEAKVDNSSFDPQSLDYGDVCTLDLNHSDQHTCPTQHVWVGSPIGFNAAQRGLDH